MKASYSKNTASSHRAYEIADIHEGPLGISKWQQTARYTIYWPEIDGNIEDYIMRCLTVTRRT